MMKFGSLSLAIFILTMITANSVSADPIGQLYLSGYVITKSSDNIGEIRVRSGKIMSAKVTGDQANAFSVDKANKLTVRKGKLNTNTGVFDITVVAQTSAGEVRETFKIVNDNFIVNKVIAHRGAWKNTGATENSISALNHAVELGCQGSEFDVHMSSDSVPMVNHDASIQGTSIANTKFSDLTLIKLSNGEPLPKLESFLKTGIAQTKTKLILEIKESELGKESSIALTRKIVAMVERLHAQAWTDYISFDYDVCLEVMKLAPYAKVAYLKSDKAPSELVKDKFYGFDYHFSVVQKNPNWIKEAHDLKQTVNVWTVNDKSVLEDMLRQQVDFITTNEPELLLEMVKK